MGKSKPAGGLPNVVIVGGGFGGLQAARALRRAAVRVTLIDRTNYHLFQPLLYQVATAGLSPGDIAAPIRSILARQANAQVLMREVTGVDAAEQQVRMGDMLVPYDYLVLATGARHGYFGHEEWEPFAPGLKTISDSTAIRREILLAFEAAEMAAVTGSSHRDAKGSSQGVAPILTFAIVGAGPAGVEMAGSIGELARHALASDFRHIDPASARVVLLEAAPRILGAYPEDLALKAQRALERMGVEVRLNTPVEEITADGIQAGGDWISTRNVVWMAGVLASPAGEWIGADTDRSGRVKVERDLSVLGHPDIFVIGDTARFEQGGQPVPGVAPAAMQQGRYVASVIQSKVSKRPAPPPFHYRDKGSLATVGRSYAIISMGPLRLTGFVAWLAWLVIHIFFLIGFRNRVFVLFQWIWAYLTWGRGVRLITPPSKSEIKKAEAERREDKRTEDRWAEDRRRGERRAESER